MIQLRNMRKYVALLLMFPIFFMCSCASSRMGNPGAIMAGAMIGGNLGSSIGGLVGDRHHRWGGGYRGSAIGNIVGTVAGAAIGHALTAPHEPVSDGVYEPEVHNVYVKRIEPAPKHIVLPSLQLRNIRFIDDNRNHVIEANENSKVIFEVMNVGKTAAYNVIPIVETVGKVKAVEISHSIMVEQILPGEGIRYTATIYAGSKLKAKEITFRVAVADKDGHVCDAREFTLPAQKKRK